MGSGGHVSIDTFALPGFDYCEIGGNKCGHCTLALGRDVRTVAPPEMLLLSLLAIGYSESLAGGERGSQF
jgi:hypothetical protein